MAQCAANGGCKIADHIVDLEILLSVGNLEIMLQIVLSRVAHLDVFLPQNIGFAPVAAK
jgi:hypothetical protein